MKKTISILLAIIVVFALTACGKPSEVPYYTTDEETFDIETKYCKLSYPTKWKEAVSVDISETGVYTVSFSAGETKLFDLMFGGSEGYLLGTLTQDGNAVEIFLNSYDIEKDRLSEDEYLNRLAMSEDVNVIISRLIENYEFNLA